MQDLKNQNNGGLHSSFPWPHPLRMWVFHTRLVRESSYIHVQYIGGFLCLITNYL